MMPLLLRTFEFLTEGEIANHTKSVNVIAPRKYICEEEKLEFVTLNASAGPIYIGRILKSWKVLCSTWSICCEGAVVKRL
jgi:hypothetical protein